MMKNQKQIKLGYSQQRGLALIMSLVILLVLTLLGVTSMNTSNLQTLMTSNSQYQTTALNTAEDVTRTAEAAVEAHVAGGAQPAGYSVMVGSGKDFSSYAWPNAEVASVGSSKYVIEYAGETALNSSSLAWRQSQGISGSNVSVFRITTRTAATRGAVRYLQSIYVTVDAPA